jgi:hypothetical protein
MVPKIDALDRALGEDAKRRTKEEMAQKSSFSNKCASFTSSHFHGTETRLRQEHSMSYSR